MPGITGIISKTPKQRNVQDLKLMVASLIHEPFYTSGTYTNDTIGIYTGWVCHQGSFSDCMPVWNEKKDKLLIFFGETFTDLELFDQLKAKHHKFDSTNASYIIHLYEEQGIEFLQDLNGWFCGILIDLRAGRVMLFNDRYGMQKIFYYQGKEAFYFSSEAKALLRICPELREIDTKGLAEYLSCSCVLEYRTLFKNVFLLPGSSLWIFEQDGNLAKKCYFNSEIWENQPWLEKEFFYEQLKDTIPRVFRRYFRTSQKIGISLTGGLDSRVIMANVDMPAGKYPCYTFGGMYRDCYDVKVARKITDVSQQLHHTLHLDRSFLADFPKYAEKTIYISDGCFDISGSYEVYLNRMAREIAPIRMTGNYGGEVLRGIGGMLRAVPLTENLFNPDLNDHVKNAKEIIDHYSQSYTNLLTYNLFKELPLLRNHGFPIEQSQLTPRTPYLDNELVALMYRAPPNTRNNMELTLRLIRDGNPKLAAIPSDRGFGGDRTFLHSMLKELHLNFLFKAEYAYNYGMPQWLAKIDYPLRFLHLERIFLGRHKFAHFRLWFRDELAGYVKCILLDEHSLRRPYLNREAVYAKVNAHTKGTSNYTNNICTLLTLELIHRSLEDSIY